MKTITKNVKTKTVTFLNSATGATLEREYLSEKDCKAVCADETSSFDFYRVNEMVEKREISESELFHNGEFVVEGVKYFLTKKMNVIQINEDTYFLESEAMVEMCNYLTVKGAITRIELSECEIGITFDQFMAHSSPVNE